MSQSACQGDSYGSKVTSPSSLMCLEHWDLTGGSKVEHNLCCVLHIWHQNLWNEEAIFFLTLRCHLITLSVYFVAPAIARRSLLSAVIAASRFFPSCTMKQIKSLSQRHAWKWKWKWSRSVVSDSLRPRGLKPTRLLCPWDFPGKNTGVGCRFLL